MEDALAPWMPKSMVSVSSLNPCSNGRCTRTSSEIVQRFQLDVLILVLMEDALALIRFDETMNKEDY